MRGSNGSDVVKNLCQVSQATLRLLQRLQRFSCQDLLIYLVLTLILSFFLYADVVFFVMRMFRRLSFDFNASIRYVYCLRRFDLIYPFAQGLFGCTLEEY
jgi:hypothetical protein